MTYLLYIIILISILLNILLIIKTFKSSELPLQDINEKFENKSDISTKKIDSFITLFLQVIDDITRYNEYLLLNMKNISEQSTLLTSNSRSHIVELQDTQTQIKDMHKLLNGNSKISEGIGDKFKVVNSNVVERQKHIINAINEYRVVQDNINLSKRSIDELVGYIKEVEGTVVTINNISRQIDMLSLNAAIEASRAGNFGRGFSVVANEIKKLSAETSGATNNISNVLKNINSKALNTQGDIENTIDILNSQHSMLEETVSSIEEITRIVMDTLNSIEILAHKNVESYDTCTKVNSTATTVVQAIEDDMNTIGGIDASLKNESNCIEQLSSSTTNLKKLSKNLFDLLEVDDNTIVAVTEEYPPFVIESTDVNKQGIDIDIIREICSRNDINFKLFFAPFDLALNLVKEGVVHMIPTLSYTEERNKFMNFTEAYREENKFILITNKQGSKEFNCYNDMKGLKIGIINMYTYPFKFLKDESITKDENLKLDTLFDKLLMNQIDAILLNDYIGNYYINSNKLQAKVKISEYILNAEENFDVRLGISKIKNIDRLTDLFNKEFKRLSEEDMVRKIENKYIIS